MAHLCIVMATYNGEKYLSQMLDSLVAQTRLADSIIVVDDGSEDSTVSILQRYTDRLPLEIIQFEHNQGHRVAFARALEEAKKRCSESDYIALADQDDIWLPQKNNLLINEMGKHNADMILGDAKVVDSKGDLLSNSWRTLGKIPEHLSLRAIMTGFTNATGCLMLFRASLLDDILPIPVDIPIHDQWITFCAAARNGYLSIKEPVILYRIHESNAIGLGHNQTWTGNLKLNLHWAKTLQQTPHYQRLSAGDQKFLDRYVSYLENRIANYFLPQYLFWIIQNAKNLYPHIHSRLPMIPRILYGIIGARFAAKFMGRS